MKKIIPQDAVLLPDSAELKFQGMIFDVYQWPQQLFDGTGHTFEMLKRPDTVSAICLVDDKILILDDEQPNRGSRKTFPGGRIDPEDTSAEAAAQREVHEETGYSFKEWRLLKVAQPVMKMEWFVYVWLAWDVVNKEEPHVDPGEKIQVHELTLTDLKALIADKSAYMVNDSGELLEDVSNLDGLLALPEFQGREVDR
ncbi:hypothetical protein COY17_04445 [Candidatus Saccharibacteria bacterium CG_4_10_14_0_2_um_filter_52_9]|nr:MAG: hypothetical protein COY17_04445 [Candidatus Saccharibacteria bacterium CG_4_10_14_0_2_um_filter_52_9]